MAQSLKNGRRAKSDAPAPEAAGSPTLLKAAEETFELTKLSWLLRARRRRKGAQDLTEAEFLTLDLISRQEAVTVGQLRRNIGVLPAQMSRILRSLERRGDKALVKCAINPVDRRRIDVSITDAGRKAYRAFCDTRVSLATDTLGRLPPEDLRDFMRLMAKIRSLLLPQLEKE